MVFSDMAAYLSEVVAVEVDELAAVKAFQVEVVMAALFLVDVLEAGAGLAVEGILPDSALFHQSVELAVYGSHAHGSTLS